MPAGLVIAIRKGPGSVSHPGSPPPEGKARQRTAKTAKQSNATQQIKTKQSNAKPEAEQSKAKHSKAIKG
jgi:hypothetical protein